MVVFELIVLIGFGVAAIVRAVSSRPEGWLAPSLDWFNPISIGSASALAAGLAGAALLYWGWDATVMLSEESEHRTENPGRAAVLTTIVLVLFYLIGAVGVLAWAGPGRIAANPDDLLGLLTSCIAGGLFLPIGGARVMLSMARRGALPAALATVHHRYRTPSVATVVFTVVSLAFYLVMTIVSDTLLVDTITSVGPLVAGYYGLTGLAGAYYFRSALRDGVGPALSKVVIPLLGSVALGWVAVKNAADLAAPAASSGRTTWFGLGAPFVLTLVMLALGAVGAVVAGFVSPRFVRDPGPGDPR
jgi:amino acid transporter